MMEWTSEIGKKTQYKTISFCCILFIQNIMNFIIDEAKNERR